MRDEPGSFRDPSSRVFYGADGGVLRALSSEGLAEFRALADSGLLADPRLVRTEEVTSVIEAPDLRGEPAAGLLAHERVPFVSYPYEWTFSMLHDAAMLQLDLLLDAVDHGLMLKDSTPYNVQFVGSRPVFVDIGSFERLRESELWVGYRQFCMLYLYPLLLQATKGVSFQPRLRGAVDGISPAEMRALTSLRDRLRRGYLTHVYLHARLDRRDRGEGSRLRSRLQRPGLGTQVIRANVGKMRKLVRRLGWTPPESGWTRYGDDNSYSPDDALRKDDIVRNALAALPGGLVWDLGCNNGRHSRIAAETADTVVAMDADHGSVERLYRALRAEGDERILPLVVDVADPSPGLGWRNAERRELLGRGRPDVVLALALVHHLAIAANIPVREIVRWLAGTGGALLVEFPTPEDVMVRKMLATKRPGLHADYRQDVFEACLREMYDVRNTQTLASGTRVLYFCVPRRGRLEVAAS